MEAVSAIRTSEKVGALLAALAQFQASLKPIPKEAVNPHFRSKYADLPSIMEEVNPLLAKAGLLVQSFMLDGGEGRALLATRIWHITSGEWMESVAGCGLPKDDAQGAGAANTYLRRYSLCALGVVTEADDDGNTASRAPAQRNGGASYQGQSQGPRNQPAPQSKRPAPVNNGDEDIPF